MKLFEHKKSRLSEAMNTKVTVAGLEYNAKQFDSEDKANKFLEGHSDWGVIKTEKDDKDEITAVYVAKNSDKGKKLTEATDTKISARDSWPTVAKKLGIDSKIMAKMANMSEEGISDKTLAREYEKLVGKDKTILIMEDFLGAEDWR